MISRHLCKNSKILISIKRHNPNNNKRINSSNTLIKFFQIQINNKINNNKYEQPKPAKIIVFKRMFRNLSNHQLIITKYQ